MVNEVGLIAQLWNYLGLKWLDDDDHHRIMYQEHPLLPPYPSATMNEIVSAFMERLLDG